MDRTLTKFMQEAGEVELLSPSQEQELGRRIINGDMEARDLMIRANIRLTFHIARQWQGRGMNLEDLVMEGTLGLIRATESFDPERKIRFATYACYWIRQSVQRALMNYAKIIRIPAYMYELITEWRKTENNLKDNGKDYSPAKIAKIMGLTKRKLAAVQAAINLTVLNESNEEDKTKLLDMIASKEDKDITSTQEEIHTMLAEMNNLTTRERDVLKLRFGIDSEEETLLLIGQKIGVTRERVRQIEAIAIGKLMERIQQRKFTSERKRGLTTVKPR